MLASNTLPQTFAGHATFVRDSKLYVVGGNASGTIFRTVTAAPIMNSFWNDTFGIGTWSDMGGLPNTSEAGGIWQDGNKVYLLSSTYGTDAGAAGSFVKSNLQQGLIDNTGRIQWVASVSGPPLKATATTSMTVTANQNYLYIGNSGTNSDTSSASTNQIWSASYNRAIGLIGSWSLASKLPVVISGYSMATCKNTLFICGGQITSSSYSALYYAQTQENGTLGAWTALALPDNSTWAGMSCIAIDKYLYIMGGYTSTNGTVYTENPNIYRFTVIDGKPVQGQVIAGLTVPRDTCSICTDGKFIYLSGGYSLGGTGTLLNTIEVIKVK